MYGKFSSYDTVLVQQLLVLIRKITRNLLLEILSANQETPLIFYRIGFFILHITYLIFKHQESDSMRNDVSTVRLGAIQP